MNFVRRRGSCVVIQQVPFVLLFVGGMFSLPPLAFALFTLVTGRDADGQIFCLFFGLLMLWLFLEFVATRERVEIDVAAGVLERTVRGFFRIRRQSVSWHDARGITLERRLERVGAGRLIWFQSLYLEGSLPQERVLLNSPAKVYLDHRKLGRMLHEVTGLPLQEIERR